MLLVLPDTAAVWRNPCLHAYLREAVKMATWRPVERYREKDVAATTEAAVARVLSAVATKPKHTLALPRTPPHPPSPAPTPLQRGKSFVIATTRQVRAMTTAPATSAAAIDPGGLLW